jgi:hypothetical protein
MGGFHLSNLWDFLTGNVHGNSMLLKEINRCLEAVAFMRLTQKESPYDRCAPSPAVSGYGRAANVVFVSYAYPALLIKSRQYVFSLVAVVGRSLLRAVPHPRSGFSRFDCFYKGKRGVSAAPFD